MRTRRRVAGVATWVILAGTASSAAAQSFETRSYSFTAMGPTRILSDWKCWFADCRFAACHMEAVERPRLGTLRPSVAPSVIRDPGGRCDGVASSALSITYTPRPGAHGADEVVLRSIADNGKRHLITIHLDIP